MKEKDPFDFSLMFVFKRDSRGLRRFERIKAEAMQGLYEGKSLSPNDAS